MLNCVKILSIRELEPETFHGVWFAKDPLGRGLRQGLEVVIRRLDQTKGNLILWQKF
jgi:hypothetical protein